MEHTRAAAETVLVVDDDARLRHLVDVILSGAGFHVVTAEDGDGIVDLVRMHRVDLVCLDLKMPRVDGIAALRALRAAGEEVGVIILTAAGDEQLVVTAFEAGADDYVTKPFLSRVLLARLRAVLRRARQDRRRVLEAERIAGIELDPLTHHVSVEGRRVALSPTEYELLRTLMQGAGQVFTSDELLRRVWGPEYVGQDEIVRANIYRLRRKLEPAPSSPRYIRGRRGVGYHFNPRPAT